MRKIGILTVHRACNYGAVLQCYALQNYLIEQGYQVEIIDYRPSTTERRYALLRYSFSIRGAYHLLRQIFKFRVIHKRYQRKKIFNEFIKSDLRLSKKQYNRTIKSEGNYDYYIIGSDQLWNPVINGINKTFWGDFKTKEKAKKITYAVSSAYYSYNYDQLQYIEKQLNAFSYISVREKQLREYLQDTLMVNSQVVCDPVLLIKRQTWEKMAITPKVDSYVLAFFPKDSVMSIASKIASSKQIKLKAIVSDYNNDILKKNCEICSVHEFLGLFKQASVIVASSYHAVLFSIIFNREFYYLKWDSRSDTRVISILESIGLEDRAIESIDDIKDIESKIDYLLVEQKLDLLRTDSKNFLNEALN